MLNLNALKTQISGANDNDRLRLNSNQKTELLSGSFFGRQVTRLSSGTLTASRSTENKDVKAAVAQALRGHYGNTIANATNPFPNSNTPLTAQAVKQWIQAADAMTLQSLSAQLTAPRNPANTDYESENFNLKQALVAHLSEKYSDAALNQALKVVDMSPGKTWTALDIQRLNNTAQALHLQPQNPAATSNHASAYFGDTNEVGQAQHLGAGTTNAVSVSQWSQQSEVTDKVFKPLPEQAPSNMQEHGIKAQGDGNLAGRNVASSEVAYALGMPDKITASHIGQQNGVQGIFMDKAQGTSIATESLVVTLPTPYSHLSQAGKDALDYVLRDKNLEIASSNGTQIRLQVKHADSLREEAFDKVQQRIQQLNEDLAPDAQVHMSATGAISAGPNAAQDDKEYVKNALQNKLTAALTITTLPLDHNGKITAPQLNLELNQMQWLDFICGQADRNPGNIFIQYGAQGGATGIAGIDQDLSFGEKVDAQFQGGFFRGMPAHIDGDTASKIKALYKNDGVQFAEMLHSNGLTPQEVTQAKSRLKSAYDAILQWETQPASATTQGILPAQSAQWSQINTDGYSKHFAETAHTNKNNVNVAQLQVLLNTSEPALLKLKADIEVQRHIGTSLQDICNQSGTPAGQALALSVLQQLTPQERAIVLSQATPGQITTLARLANAHPEAVAELQRRHQVETQRFHATVQRLQTEDLNLPTSLTNAPAFARTMVQLAETWASLQAYAAHPDTPIAPQTQAEHQFLQSYLQTQTQPDTLAADDLKDDQLGKLNQALKILTPSDKRATALQGFTNVFANEFATRLTEQSLHAASTWSELLAAPPSPTTMQATLDTLRKLNQQREGVIERAATMLMDSARNHPVVLTALQAPLHSALLQLSPKETRNQIDPWMHESIADTLKANAHLLPDTSDDEEAQLSELMMTLPSFIRATTQPGEMDEWANLLATHHRAAQLKSTQNASADLAALQEFLVNPQVSAAIHLPLQAANHTRLKNAFRTITSENRLTLDSLFLDKKNLAKGQWSAGVNMQTISKYSEFMAIPPTPADLAMLRKLTSGPTGSTDLLDFDEAVQTFNAAPSALKALDLLQTFVVATNSANSGFGLFDSMPVAQSTVSGPKEINVNAASYRKACEEVASSVRAMIHDALKAEISTTVTPLM